MKENIKRLQKDEYVVLIILFEGVCHYTGKDFYRQVKGRILKPGRFCKSGHVSVVLRRGTNGISVHQLRYGTRTENTLDVYRQGG